MQYLVERILSRVSTATLVKVTKVTNNGELAAVGQLDAQPLVNMQDGIGTNYKHGIIHNLIYFRLQNKKSAIIMDPEVNNIGVAVIADRDISVVKKNKAQAQPGSFRRFDMADGMFFPCFLGDAPTTSHLRFKGDGTVIGAFGQFMFVAGDNFAQLKKDGANHITITPDEIITNISPSSWTIAPDPHSGIDS